MLIFHPNRGASEAKKFSEILNGEMAVDGSLGYMEPNDAGYRKRASFSRRNFQKVIYNLNVTMTSHLNCKCYN